MAWAAFVLLVAQAGAMLVRFLFPNALYEKGQEFRAGTLAECARAGTVDETCRQEHGVFLARIEEDGVDKLVAVSAICTHLGCRVNWLEGERKFKCPCHGSGFFADGRNFEGPAPRPLERYAIRAGADGGVVVDKSRTFRGEAGQWKDAESYVRMS